LQWWQDSLPELPNFTLDAFRDRTIICFAAHATLKACLTFWRIIADITANEFDILLNIFELLHQKYSKG
jgi:hypothetical protein